MTSSGVAVDIGGTKIVSVASNDPRTTRRVDTDIGSGPEGILRQVIDAVDSWRTATDSRVVVASAGHLDLERGRIRDAANLPFCDYPIMAELSRSTGREVELIGDATAATVAELTHGERTRHRDGIYVTVSTGIGMGVVRAGHLDWHSGIGDAELGHLTVDTGAGAETCGCGRRGCLEAYASGASIVRRYVARSRQPSRVADAQRAGGLTVSDIVAEAGRGNQVARQVLDEALMRLSTAIVAIVRRLSASILVLGGGVMVYSGLFGPLVDRVHTMMNGDSLIIEPAAYGDLSAIHGAAAVCERSTETIEILGGPWTGLT